MIHPFRTLNQWLYSWEQTLLAVADTMLDSFAAAFSRYAERYDRQTATRIFHLTSECKHPDICPYYGHREAWEAGQIEPGAGIGLHNKGAQDEREQAGHG